MTDQHLTDEEFHQAALAGGASRHVTTGNVPDRGFMVGGARDLEGQPFAEISRPVDAFSLNDVRQHARELRDRFGEESATYQGAWREDDRVVLDASQNFKAYSDAISAAKNRGERAIYDVARDRDVHTKDARVVN